MKLTPEERRILRIVVKNVHFKMYPKEFCTDHEADKMIAVIADETKAKLVKIGKDSKIEQMQCGGCGTCGTLLDGGWWNPDTCIGEDDETFQIIIYNNE